MGSLDTTDFLPRTAVSALRAAVNGRVLRPGDPEYDQARLGWRRGIDPRPALVVEATGAHDVQAALRFARERRLPLAAQSTGHGTVTACDGGLLLKTAPMCGVQVHADRHAARVGGGARWQDVVAAAALSGLAPLSGTGGAVGVAGYTLGGGMGWLSRRFGYAADSLLSARVVTADGELVTASHREHPDLFWALRGGGGNFGVVTALTFRLYPVERVYGGTVVFGIDRAAEALACYRAWAPTEPDELQTTLKLTRLPDAPHVPEGLRGRPVLTLRVLYLGEGAQAERLLAPLRAAAGRPAAVSEVSARKADGRQALADDVRPIRYAETATRFGPPEPPAASHGNVELFHDLPDRVIEAAVAAVGDPGPVSVVEVRHWGGAPARPPTGAGPVGHRDVPFSVVTSAPIHPGQPEATARAGVDAVAARLRPHATGGTFLNYLTDPARTPTAYTPPDYQRLTEVKRAYDPDNVFNANLNIPPAPPRRS